MQIERRCRYKIKVPETKSFNWLYSAYDLEIHIGSAIVKIGRFSFGLISRLKVLPHPTDTILIRAGAFCEIGASTILLGGEHRNDSLFNYTFSSAPLFKSFMKEADHDLVSVKPAETTTIGDNVIISEGAVIASGTSIGDGCIVGAQSFVRGSLAPYGIYAGVPSKRIRDRFSQGALEKYQLMRMGDVAAHRIPELPRLAADLEEGNITEADFAVKAEYLERRPRVIIRGSLTGDQRIAFAGPEAFFIGDERIVNEEKSASLLRYFSQASNATTEVTWTPDVFDLLGLYG